MSLRQRNMRVAAAAIAAMAIRGSVSAAVVPPYTEDFSDNVADGFVATGVNVTEANGGFTAANGVYELRATGSIAGARSYASVDAAGSLGGTSTTGFTVSATGQAVTGNDAAGRFGLRFLSTNAGNDTDSYFVDVRPSDGLIRIIEFTGGSAASIGGTVTGGTLTTTNPLTLTLSGAYGAGGALDLTFTVSDGTNTRTVTASDTSPRTGTLFGLTAAPTGSGGGQQNVNFDDFSLTVVPEPATLSLLGIASLALLGRRRLRA